MANNSENVSKGHRPGLFKLPSKKHKTGRHRSKREIDRGNKGRLGVQVQALKRSKKVNKLQRKNQIRQLWLQKHEQLLEKMRIHGPTTNRAPFVVTIISMDAKFDANAVVKRLAEADASSILLQSQCDRIASLDVGRLKARFSFLCPKQDDLSEVLDCVRVSEVLLLVWPLDDVITPSRQQLLTTIMSQGMPVPIHAVVGLPPNGKQRDRMRKTLEKSMALWPSLRDDKSHNLDSAGDAQKILRLITDVQKKPSILQQRHPYLIAEQIEFVDEDLEANSCTMKLLGYVRGAPLDISKLIHVQGFGDFRLSAVDVQKETSNRQVTTVTLVPKNSTKILPINDDMEIDDQNVENSEGEYGTEESDEDDDDGGEDDASDELASATINSDDEDDDDMMSYVDNASTVLSHNDDAEAKRFRQERENAQWPDEIETPRDVPARERFVNYRGLKSFRTSSWDPKENLPPEYSRIYKFSDFKHTKKNVLAEMRKAFLSFNDEALAVERQRRNSTASSGAGDQRMDSAVGAVLSAENEQVVFPGSHVTLHITGVPLAAREQSPHNNKITAVFGLLTHEEKMSVLNMVLEKHPSCRVPLKNREALVFQVGFRRFEAAPLFSQHNNGNKFKMERFAPAEGTFCASVLAPIVFPPATVLAFRRDARNRLRIVASGNVLDLNPDRIVLKRIVLSGHPFKVNKRLAVVRYMFYNKEDVEWFKPLEVYTAKGRRGHIKESLGTHGLMKCLFDQPLTTQDLVLMNLYKRVFPNLSYTPRVPLMSVTAYDDEDSVSQRSTVDDAMEE